MNIPTSPIESAAAWRGPEQSNRTDWMYCLSDIEKAELDSAIRTYRTARPALSDIQKLNYPIPVLADAIQRWMIELDAGRGFILVRGFPPRLIPRKRQRSPIGSSAST